MKNFNNQWSAEIFFPEIEERKMLFSSYDAPVLIHSTDSHIMSIGKNGKYHLLLFKITIKISFQSYRFRPAIDPFSDGNIFDGSMLLS